MKRFFSICLVAALFAMPLGCEKANDAAGDAVDKAGDKAGEVVDDAANKAKDVIGGEGSEKK